MISTALSMSPSASVSALLQSLSPAWVLSRSSLTSCILICAIDNLCLSLGGTEERSRTHCRADSSVLGGTPEHRIRCRSAHASGSKPLSDGQRKRRGSRDPATAHGRHRHDDGAHPGCKRQRSYR